MTRFEFFEIDGVSGVGVDLSGDSLRFFLVTRVQSEILDRVPKALQIDRLTAVGVVEQKHEANSTLSRLVWVRIGHLA